MNKTITLYNSRNDRSDPPDDLQKHIEWLKAMLESIPAEFRESGKIEMDADDYCLEYQVTYDRPETAAEEDAKAKADAVLADKKRRQELATLAELKAKYPEANDEPSRGDRDSQPES